jgi:hypothetical protein
MLLKEDIELFAKLARRMKLTETKKLKNNRKKVGKRIELFHKVIRAGLEALAR